MLRLTRRTEYGLMALAYLARAEGSYCSVREIVEALNVPKRLLAEILKALSHAEVVEATRGPGGGYRLSSEADALPVSRIVSVLEGPHLVAECYGGTCDLSPSCTIKGGIGEVARRIHAVLDDVTLAEIARGSGSAPTVPVSPPSGVQG